MLTILAKSLRRYKKPAILSPVFITIEVLLECIIPLFMAKIIREMDGGSVQNIMIYGSILVLLAMLSLLCGVQSGKFSATASCGYAKNLRQDLYDAVQDFSFADVDRFSTSSLVTRLTTDVTYVQMAFQVIIRMAFRAPLMIIFSFAMGFSISWQLSLIFLAILPVLSLFLFLCIKKVFPMYDEAFKKYDELNASVQENIAGIRVVKSYVREEHEQKKMHKASRDMKNVFFRAEKILALSNPVMMFCIYLAILLVSFFGAQLIVNSSATMLEIGELSSMITYGAQILSSLMMLSMVFVMVIMAAESAKRITEVLRQKATLVSPEDGDTLVKTGSIEFRGVSFKYSEKADRYALSNIDLTVEQGHTLGILGGTGSSKTTLIQMIPRLYDATEGTVLVGGTDVRNYDLDALRNDVAVVLQKNVLFSGTIKENLRWGNPDATDEEMIAACRLAQADEFITRFPKGYDTYIERGGTNVSGGQKQRLCIARAVLKKPKILILDDSTSAVDTKTDALIRFALKKDIPDTTKIIIAQRVASVQDADSIAVLDGGKIVGLGTHDQLLETCAIYREVYDSQTKTSEQGGDGHEKE